MIEKRIASRRLFIAFVIVCIILIVCLVGAISLYSWQISDRDNTIASKNSQIDSLNTQATNLQNQVNNLTNSISDLNTTVMDLDTIISLGKNRQWNLVPEEVTEDPNSYLEWALSGEFWNLNYAGYVWIHVNSNNTSTYVELIWGNYGVHYDNQIVVGTNGTAAFPILPLGPIGLKIRVGNTDTSNGAHIFVTATYYY